MFDFSIVTNWIHELLLSIMPEGLAIFIECVAVGVCLVALYAILAIILIYMATVYSPGTHFEKN